jgi:hypothetical protein
MTKETTAGKTALRLLAALLIGLPAMLHATNSSELWLITPEELSAAEQEDSSIRPRGLLFDENPKLSDAGPIIEVLKPGTDNSLVPPFEISVRFAARTAPVNVNSLKVQVLKLIALDITERVRPYVSLRGIQIPEARLPAGQHTVRISVADEGGQRSTKIITVNIP